MSYSSFASMPDGLLTAEIEIQSLHEQVRFSMPCKFAVLTMTNLQISSATLVGVGGSNMPTQQGIPSYANAQAYSDGYINKNNISSQTYNNFFLGTSSLGFNTTTGNAIRYQGQVGDQVGVISSNVPIFTTTAVMDAYRSLYTNVTIDAPIYYVDVLDNAKNLNVNYPAYANYPIKYTEPTQIYHDVYLYKENDKDENMTVEIISHIRGNLIKWDSKIYYGGISKDDLTDLRFSAKGDTGKGNIFTNFSNLKLRCINGTTFNNFDFLLNKVYAGFYFIDRIYDDNGQYNDIYSQVGGLDKDMQHVVLENPSNVIQPPIDFVRFFTRKPTPEEEEEGGDIDRPDDDPDDEDDRPDTTPDPERPDDPIEDGPDDGSLNSFHKCYLVTEEQMRELRDKMWTQDYYDVLKVQENPIENIVSSKRFPFRVSGGDVSSITIGNIDMLVPGTRIYKGVHKIEVGHTKLNTHYDNFIDYDLTNYGVYLPYIGFKPLDPRKYLNNEIYVKYYVDLVSGICKAVLSIGGYSVKPLQEFEGQMGIDCPITATTQKQSELSNSMRFISGGLGAVGSLASIGVGAFTGNLMGVGGGIAGLYNTMTGFTNGQPTNDFSSTQSNAPISTASFNNVFIIVDRPVLDTQNIYPVSYLRNVGAPCGRTRTIEKFRGNFIKCSGDVRLNGRVNNKSLYATKEETERIKELLLKGVVV